MPRTLVLPAVMAAAVMTCLSLSAARADVIVAQAQNAANASKSPFTLLTPGLPIPPGTVRSAPVTLSNGDMVSFPARDDGEREHEDAIPAGGVYNGNTYLTPNGTYTSSPTSVQGRTTINNALVAVSPYSGTALNPANSNYLVAQPDSDVMINLGAATTSFDLLWGSVDSYNSLTVELCSHAYCFDSETISGSDIAKAANINADGSSSAFVELFDTTKGHSFDEVVLTSSSEAFEFVVGVPEPMTLTVLGSGLLGLGIARGRRARNR